MRGRSERSKQAPQAQQARRPLVASGGLGGVVASETAAEHAESLGVELGTFDELVEDGRGVALEVRPELDVEEELALAGAVEGERRQSARQAEVLEEVALLLGRLSGLRSARARDRPLRRLRRQPQVAGDGRLFEWDLDPLRRRQEVRCGPVVELGLAVLAGLAALAGRGTT